MLSTGIYFLIWTTLPELCCGQHLRASAIFFFKFYLRRYGVASECLFCIDFCLYEKKALLLFVPFENLLEWYSCRAGLVQCVVQSVPFLQTFIASIFFFRIYIFFILNVMRVIGGEESARFQNVVSFPRILCAARQRWRAVLDRVCLMRHKGKGTCKITASCQVPLGGGKENPQSALQPQFNMKRNQNHKFIFYNFAVKINGNKKISQINKITLFSPQGNENHLQCSLISSVFLFRVSF